jgi:hypothetical protein
MWTGLTRLIDRIPLIPLVLMALVMGLAPLLPQPHLVQKLMMLFDGRLNNAMDVFDLFLHGTLPCLLIVKLAFTIGVSKEKSHQEP